ncbi:hypothetical protein [Mycobacterium sp. E740]|uniref:hypothetical protein n=1 Tax=Mycobacterium sp. E740 TaxID=1834149 RepID=UPI0018D2F064|nr:hypothetical protein [Mycobacterium sp. E740]
MIESGTTALTASAAFFTTVGAGSFFVATGGAVTAALFFLSELRATAGDSITSGGVFTCGAAFSAPESATADVDSAFSFVVSSGAAAFLSPPDDSAPVTRLDVSAPPELLTAISGTRCAGVDAASADESADASFDGVTAPGTSSTFSAGAAAAGAGSEGVSAEDESSARARPRFGPATTAIPTPNATASAPTRPT